MAAFLPHTAKPNAFQRADHLSAGDNGQLSSVAAHYRHTTGFFVRAEYNGVGRYPFLEDNVQQQSAYQLVNAAIGYRRKHCGMSLYAKNLSDREYAHFGVPQPVGTGLTGSLGEPRTFGLEAWLSF